MTNIPRITNRAFETPVSTSSGEISLHTQIIKNELIKNHKKQLNALNVLYPQLTNSRTSLLITCVLMGIPTFVYPLAGS